MRRPLLVSLLLACSVASAVAAHAQDAGSLPAIEWAAPPFDVPADLRDTIRFGWLRVPQFHDSATGGMLRIAIAHIRARGGALPDPIVLIPGGPGDALVHSAVPHARSERIAPLRDRDLVLFDPRGHGYSDPVMCTSVDAAEDGATLGDPAAERALLAALGSCRDSLRALGFDPAALTSVAAARDLELLRRALGAPHLNLMGASHGSRIAAVTIREFPETVRSAALHGPHPPGSFSVGDDAPGVRGPLQVLVRRCAEQRDCAREYPSLAADIDDLFARVRTDPPAIRVPRSTFAPRGVVRLDLRLLEDALSLMLRNRASIAAVPLLVRNLAEGRYWVLAPLGSLTEDIASVSAGTAFAFHCTESIPFVRDSAALWRARCAHWVSVPGDSTVLALPHADVPVLIAAGEFDPVTPPSFGRRYASVVRRAQLLEVPHFGHDVWFSDCVRRATAAFFARPLAPVDTACLHAAPPIEFITGVAPSRWVSRGAAALALRPPLAAFPALAAALLLVAIAAFFRRGRDPARAPPASHAHRLPLLLACSAALLLLGGFAAMLFSAARTQPIALAVGAPAGWSWVALLPWLVFGLFLLAVAAFARDWALGVRRTGTWAEWSGLAGLVLVLACWGWAILGA